MADSGETFYWYHGVLSSADGTFCIAQSWNGAQRWLLERTRPTTIIKGRPPWKN